MKHNTSYWPVPASWLANGIRLRQERSVWKLGPRNRSNTGERHPFSAQTRTLDLGHVPSASFGHPIESFLTAWVAPLRQLLVVLVHLCERQCSTTGF